MREILISIQPKWCKLICSGEKTVEVRKNRPNCELPFKCYIYCTKGKPTFTQSAFCDDISNGKVIGEFVCDKIDEYPFCPYICEDGTEAPELSGYEIPTVEGEKTGMDYCEAAIYGNRNPLYFWHISDLVIYDKPRELSEFYNPDKILKSQCMTCVFNDGHGHFKGCKGDNCWENTRLKRPPQSWCYIEPRQTAD